MNVFDYLKWRDDIELNEINECDVLIFNMIAYFPLEKIMKQNEKLTISDINTRFSNSKENINFNKNERKILDIISKSIRYKDLIITNIISKQSLKKEEQFMACTILLNKKTIYVAFRGTDDNIFAWKEDFTRSFMEPVSAQVDALEYVNNLRKFKKIYLGGHSKGGNLAMYAGIHASSTIKRRIIKIFNYDGPGFLNLDESYHSVKDKIINYIPGFSIVGRLMNNDAETIVVQSSNKGIFQHDLYGWQIEKKSLIRTKITKDSNTIKKIIDEWMQKTDIKTRKEFIDSTFNIINSTGVQYIREIKISDFVKIIKSYEKMNKESKALLFKVIGCLLESTKENLKK